MQKIQALAGFTDEATGRNRAQRGLFTKGNRTKEEYVDTMQNASGRDQLVGMLYEAQVFTPMKEMLKLNILQYQGGTSLYSAAQQQTVKVDPVALRKATINFKMADGLTPVGKEMSEDELQTAIQTIGSSPQIASGYNITPMFSYLMKLRGADLKPFEKSGAQVAYESAVSQWQQTVQQTVESMTKAGQDPAATLQAMPQPTPQQFGYTPGLVAQDSATPPNNQTIMQQITASATTSTTAQPTQPQVQQ
jgi:hypothetical protein